MILKNMVAGVLTTMALMSTAYAATCPEASSIMKTASGYTAPGPNGTQQIVNVIPDDATELKSLKFTSARLQDKDSNGSVVICRYEGDGDLGASTGWRTGAPVKGTGSNWKSDDCVANDPAKCSFS